MKLMSREKKPLSQRQEAVAEKVAGRIVQGQRRLAGYLNRRTAGLSGKTWLLLLIAFCLAFGSYLIYLLVQVWV
jgi:hypothetical protein